jgi:hypothetical protein
VKGIEVGLRQEGLTRPQVIDTPWQSTPSRMARRKAVCRLPAGACLRWVSHHYDEGTCRVLYDDRIAPEMLVPASHRPVFFPAKRSTPFWILPNDSISSCSFNKGPPHIRCRTIFLPSRAAPPVARRLVAESCVQRQIFICNRQLIFSVRPRRSHWGRHGAGIVADHSGTVEEQGCVRDRPLFIAKPLTATK